MATTHGLSRRAFLRAGMLGFGGVGLGLLPACAPPAPRLAPTPAEALATAPAGPDRTATPPAAQPPGAAVVTGGAEAKPGRHLVGRLEGPVVVTDPARWPAAFNEAPMLAELVRAGKLPPVDRRLPREPLVVQPVHEIGAYGGTWRRGFTGPADGENGNRIVSTDKLLFWDYTGTANAPCVAGDWVVGEDGRTITISLRRGMRWSDGAPFGADDFVFWYEDIYRQRELVATPTPELSIDGKPGTIEKIDEHTVAFKFPEPYPLFVDVLSGDTDLGRGQAVGQSNGRMMGAYAPADYLKQFHPGYVPKAELDEKVSRAGVDTWVSLLKLKMDWQLNPELPVLGPWRTVTPINTPTWTLERNPYYWAVDTAGNQLPYIDRIQMTLAENLEVLNLRAIAGEYDLQERHVDWASCRSSWSSADGAVTASTSIRPATEPTPPSTSTRATTRNRRWRDG